MYPQYTFKQGSRRFEPLLLEASHEARQIWQFSKVRAQSPKAVDQVGTIA